MSMKLNTIVFHAIMLLVSRMFALSFKAGKALFFDTLETLECCFFSFKDDEEDRNVEHKVVVEI